MKRIVMIGSSRATRGGISALVNVYHAHGLFERWDAEYLETHCDGSAARKAMKALACWLAFMARLLTGRVSALHVHIASDASFWRKALFVLPAHALGVPYLLHMHGGDFSAFYERRCGPAARRLLRYLYRNAHAVVALSGEWRATLEAAIPGMRVVVIPNPVEIPPWQAQPEAEPPTALFMGVVKEAKGAFDLLHAWAPVLRVHPRARLILAGSGELERAGALAARLGIAHSVEMPGWVVGEAKAGVLRRASLSVLPSHFEALPMAVLEAMAAGLPVVATRVGGIPEAVEDGVSGILIERDPGALERALVSLLGDPARRVELGRAARRRATQAYSDAVLVPRVEELWAEIAPRANRTIPVSSPSP